MSVVWIVFVLVVAAGAIFDLLTYRIPNTVIVALALLFGVVAAVNYAQVPWFNHLAAGGLSLAVGLGLYALGQMGAGDAKLVTIIATWAGLGGLMPFLLWLAVSGFGLVVVILGMRGLLNITLRRKSESEHPRLPRVLKRGEGIPYGVAIALGALISSGHFPAWLWRF